MTWNPIIVECFEIITEESAMNGDVEDHGIEAEHSMLPDEFDREEGLDHVELAIEFLADKCIEPSCSDFVPGIWFTDADPEIDLHTGEHRRSSWHLHDFNVTEQIQIWQTLKDREVI